MQQIGVLALQGGVHEHLDAVRGAAEKARIPISLRTARTARELDGLQGLLLPGGESTTLSLLLQKNQMLEQMKNIPGLFGTCAGLILMAKEVEGKLQGQEGLDVMDVGVSRNTYGSQINSFESQLEAGDGRVPSDGAEPLNLTGRLRIPFIRAPRITRVDEAAGVKVLARLPSSGEPVIVEQKLPGRFYLGAACHPELKTAKVHEYFLRELATALKSA